jgi:hypothetical protein
MSRIRSFYSIIQYVPDPGRAEAANVGVVLFVPGERRIEVRESRTLERVRKFFAPGRMKLQRIQIAIEALKNRLILGKDEFSDEAAFAQFVAARADVVRLTAPRLAMIGDPHVGLSSLYDELVGDAETGKELAAPLESLPARIADILGRLAAEGRVWRPGVIEVPRSGGRFEVSFAYQNGALNYVKAEALAGHTKLQSRLTKLAFNGQLIHEHPLEGQQRRLVVLSSDPSVRPETEARFESTLSDFNVRFIPYRSADEFASEIERTAHV